jgi:large subunit ribosomal protein L15e
MLSGVIILSMAVYHQRKKSTKTALRELMKKRLVEWRRQRVVTKIEKPTQLHRARRLGYKPKPGFVLARVRVRRGGRRRRLRGRRGRKPAKAGLVKFTPAKSLQRIAEEKANRKFVNLEVIGSYLVGEDGQYRFFEILMVDPCHPNILSDPQMSWVCKLPRRRRTVRKLTTRGKARR